MGVPWVFGRFGKFPAMSRNLRGGGGDGAGAEEVGGAEVAAVAGVVGEELGGGPVEVGGFAFGEAVGREIGVAHRLGEEVDFQSQIEGAGLLVEGVVEVGQGARVAFRAWGLGAAEGSQGFGGDDPGEMVVWKLFARKGPKGWVSQVCRSRADQSFSRQ